MSVIEIIEAPKSVNVPENSPVNFTCIAVADTIIFYVNGTVASNNKIIAKGFMQSQIKLIMDHLTRSLLLTSATADLNNTEIYCRAVHITGNSSNSDSAVLKIQG